MKSNFFSINLLSRFPFLSHMVFVYRISLNPQNFLISFVYKSSDKKQVPILHPAVHWKQDTSPHYCNYRGRYRNSYPGFSQEIRTWTHGSYLSYCLFSAYAFIFTLFSWLSNYGKTVRTVRRYN